MMSDIQVTVRCITYNHVAYIEQCLTSLVSQKTTFSYEVLVFDDASTDGTSDIVRRFAEEYPNIIVPVIHSSNHYSRGIDTDEGFLDLAKGKYVAFCEGDDYWCSDDKLQEQFDYMESHPDCRLHCHAVAEFDDQKQKIACIRKASDTEADVSLERVLFNFTSFGTNSMMYRRVDHELPKAFRGWGVGDYPRFIYSKLAGNIHYSTDIMSAYRTNVPGSWTSRNRSLSAKKRSTEMIAEGLHRADEYSGLEYHELFDWAAYLQKRDYLLASKEWNELTKGELSNYFHKDTFKKKLIAWARCFLPDAITQRLIDFEKARTGMK